MPIVFSFVHSALGIVRKLANDATSCVLFSIIRRNGHKSKVNCGLHKKGAHRPVRPCLLFRIADAGGNLGVDPAEGDVLTVGHGHHRAHGIGAVDIDLCIFQDLQRLRLGMARCFVLQEFR